MVASNSYFKAPVTLKCKSCGVNKHKSHYLPFQEVNNKIKLHHTVMCGGCRNRRKITALLREQGSFKAEEADSTVQRAVWSKMDDDISKFYEVFQDIVPVQQAQKMWDEIRQDDRLRRAAEFFTESTGKMNAWLLGMTPSPESAHGFNDQDDQTLKAEEKTKFKRGIKRKREL